MNDFFNQLQIDWKTAVVVLIIIVGAIILTRLTRWFANQLYASVAGKIKMDSTRYHFMKNAMSLVIWILAFASIVSMVP